MKYFERQEELAKAKNNGDISLEAYLRISACKYTDEIIKIAQEKGWISSEFAQMLLNTK